MTTDELREIKREPDCDGSEYCRAKQHIEGCYNGPPPPPPEPEPDPWADIERLEREPGWC